MVGSPIRAAIMPPMNTVGEPMAMASGGPGQTHMSVSRAAAMPPMITVGQHGGKIGPPTCGTGPVNMGQVCISVIRAAGGINDAPIPGLRQTLGQTLGQNSWGLRYPVHAPSSICRIVIGNTPPGLNLIGDRSRAGIPDAAASRMTPRAPLSGP